MNADTAILHLLSPGGGEHHLTNAEEKRAATFRFLPDAERWAAWRSGLRRVLAGTLGVWPLEVPILISDFGKPLLAPPFDTLHFSLSHCNDLAIVALCVAGTVGADLEPLTRAPELLGCEGTFCDPAEIATLPADPLARGLALLEIWTAKEALLKALGTGFSHPPEEVRIQRGGACFTATSVTPLPGITGQVIQRIHHPLLAAYCAALSVPAGVSRLEVVPPEGSTSAAASV